MSQRSTAQHYHTDTPFCTIRKSHVTWNFAVPVPHSEEIRRCILLFLCTLAWTHCTLTNNPTSAVLLLSTPRPTSWNFFLSPSKSPGQGRRWIAASYTPGGLQCKTPILGWNIHTQHSWHKNDGITDRIWPHAVDHEWNQLDTLMMVTPEVSSICMRLIVPTLFIFFISFHFIAYILRGLQKSNIHTCQSCSPARVLVPGKWQRR